MIAHAVRTAVAAAGLQLYLSDGYCATVTVVEVPRVDSAQLLKLMDEKYGVMIAGCFDILAGKVIRLGPTWAKNANVSDVTLMLDALDNTFADLGYPLQASLKEVFQQEIYKNSICFLISKSLEL